MSMRIGRVDGRLCKNIRRNHNGTIQVQPVEVIKDGPLAGKLRNCGEQFVVAVNKFIKGKA